VPGPAFLAYFEDCRTSGRPFQSLLIDSASIEAVDGGLFNNIRSLMVDSVFAAKGFPPLQRIKLNSETYFLRILIHK